MLRSSSPEGLSDQGKEYLLPTPSTATPLNQQEGGTTTAKKGAAKAEAAARTLGFQLWLKVHLFAGDRGSTVVRQKNVVTAIVGLDICVKR